MSSLRRVSLNVILILTPVVGSGCAQMSQQTVYRQTMSTSDPRMNAARLQESRGNLAQAKERYIELFKENPRNVESAHRLGVICTQLNQHGEAEVYYRQAYAVTPNDPELLADMGYSAFQRKDFEKADAFLEQSVRINGNDPRAIQNLAIARAWRGKDQSSLATFRLIYPEDEALRCVKAIQLARGGNVRTETNDEGVAKTNPRKPENLNGMTQSIAPDVDAMPVYLPSPSPSPTPAATSPQSMPIESPHRPADLILTAGIEETIELPSPLPPPPPLPSLASASIQSAPAEQLSPVKVLVEKSEPQVPSAIPAEIPSDPGRCQVDSVSLTVATSEAVVETIIPPSPTEVLPTEVTLTEVRPAQVTPAEAPPVSKPRALTFWRKTSPSRVELVDLEQVKPRDLEEWQAPTVTQFSEEMKEGWGICLVTLLEENRLEIGLPQYLVEYEMRRYRFSSAEAMKQFQMNPQKYAPFAAGRDIVAARNDQREVQGSLNFALRYRKQLYLFSTAENARSFRNEPEKYVDVE